MDKLLGQWKKMCIFDFGGGEQVEQDVFYYMKASSLKE